MVLLKLIWNIKLAKDYEEIIDDGICLAIIVRNSYRSDGIKFFTPNNFSQQLGYMNRPTGYRIEPHVHNHIQKEVRQTQEVLFIRKGKLRIDFYKENMKYLESRILESGDVILLSGGGHGIEILQHSEILEVKQGPYQGEKDKKRFSFDESVNLKISE